MQHSQKQGPLNTRSSPFSQQSPPYDPSIPPSTLVLTPQRTNDFDVDGERTVQVDGLPDIP